MVIRQPVTALGLGIWGWEWVVRKMKIPRLFYQGHVENYTLVSRVTSAGVHVQATIGGFLGEKGKEGVFEVPEALQLFNEVHPFDIFMSSHLSSHMSWGD